MMYSTALVVGVSRRAPISKPRWGWSNDDPCKVQSSVVVSISKEELSGPNPHYAARKSLYMVVDNEVSWSFIENT